MRAYFFGNMYLSSIQQGIQAAHATHELFLNWSTPSVAHTRLMDWAANHKTMILLNGGYSDNIQSLVDIFKEQDDHVVEYPWAEFREEQASLNGALTTVGIILPEKIYQMSAAIRKSRKPRGEPTLADRIMMDGEITVIPGNDEYGFNVDKPTKFTYSKFEYDLMIELNKYGLAS